MTECAEVDTRIARRLVHICPAATVTPGVI